MKARVLIDDCANRFHAGEIGDILETDKEKYDYLLKLPGHDKLPECLGGHRINRYYYFYDGEIEILEQ